MGWGGRNLGRWSVSVPYLMKLFLNPVFSSRIRQRHLAHLEQSFCPVCCFFPRWQRCSTCWRTSWSTRATSTSGSTGGSRVACGRRPSIASMVRDLSLSNSLSAADCVSACVHKRDTLSLAVFSAKQAGVCFTKPWLLTSKQLSWLTVGNYIAINAFWEMHPWSVNTIRHF